MDLSKAFDSIPPRSYESKNTCLWFFNRCCQDKQNVRINNIHSVFQILLSGVPEDSILGPLLFNIFINYLYLWISKTDLFKFADDNTISAAENTIEKLISTLQ